MESLSPECTPLKHRYDACFNAWFEGYLQPALDSSSSATNPAMAMPDGPNHTTSSSAVSSPQRAFAEGSGISQPGSVPAVAVGTPADGTSPASARLVTNWSRAIGRSSIAKQATEAEPESSIPGSIPEHVSANVNLPPIDIRGKSRAQIKAEQYDRACGDMWKEYKQCLEKGIKQNQNLSTLLAQARDEHPLKSERGLEGTPWDPNSEMDD